MTTSGMVSVDAKRTPLEDPSALSMGAILSVMGTIYPDVLIPELSPWFNAALEAPSRGHVGAVVPAQRETSRQPAIARALESCDAVRLGDLSVDAPKIRTPFVLQRLDEPDVAGLLMTDRMWVHQRRLQRALRLLCVDAAPVSASTRALMGRLYGDDKQALRAAELATSQRLSIITGGPGTGKTWGLRRILALLLTDAEERGDMLRVTLTAPTGKAAVRMREALGEHLDELRSAGVTSGVLERIQGLSSSTLHRVLKVKPRQPQRFVHGHDAPLAADVVVVDEASMVDITLMRHLVEAVATGTARLILLGDPDQLASVGAGSVLSDLVEVSQDAAHPLSAHTARLWTSHRFGRAASISMVATALQRGDPSSLAAAAALMRGEVALCLDQWPESDPLEPRGELKRIEWMATQGETLQAALIERLARGYVSDPHPTLGAHGSDDVSGYLSLLRSSQSERQTLRSDLLQRQCLEAFARYRILCAHYFGPRGVDTINACLTSLALKALSTSMRADGHWLGRPVLIRENAVELGLSNGDVGLVLPDAAGTLRFCIDQDDSLRRLPLESLPDHGTAFAMSGHKSQGSQFDHVVVVLPEQRGSPVTNRNWLYTVITRSKWRLSWLGDAEVLHDAVHRTMGRATGLAALLRAPSSREDTPCNETS